MDIKRTSLAILLTVCLALSGTAPAVAASEEIVIDGYYDDWEDKPHTEVYQGNNPQPKHISLVGMFREDDRLCVHIVFAEQYSSGIKNMEVEIESNLGSAVFELDENPVYDKNVMLIERPVIDNGGLDESSDQLELHDPEQDGGQDQDPELDSVTNDDGGTEPAPEASVRHLLLRLGARLFVYAEGEEDMLSPGGEGDGDSDGEADSSQEEAGKVDGSEEGGESGESEEPENGEDEPDSEADDEFPETRPSLQPAAKPQPPEEVIREFTVKLDGDPVGTGYMTVVGTTVVEAEFCIPLYTINAQADGISDIQMQIKKLGKQWLYWSGVGSGPYIGIAVSLIAGLGIGVYLHRKKRVGAEVEE